MSTIIGKYERALRESHESEHYFAEIDMAAPQQHKLNWQDEIEHAESVRQANVDSMDVMLPRITRGPTLKEVEATLATRAATKSVARPIAAADVHQPALAAGNTDRASLPVSSSTDEAALHAWLVSGFKIEDEQ